MSPRTPSALLHTLRTPGHRRTLLLRRALATILLLAAALSALHSSRDTGPQALVMVRDVPAGSALSTDDLRLLPIPEQLLPAGSLIDAAQAEGSIAATTLKVGMVPTDTDLVGTALVRELLGEDGTLVPLKLADPDLIPLLHHGDTVTVLSQAAQSPAPEILATGARVVLADQTPDTGTATLLVALPEVAAHQVAAAALHAPLAVVLTGERARFPGEK